MNQHEQIAKSRLGRLLVNRGYITEDQLSDALVAQAQEGVLLGEVLVSRGLISEKDLSRTLKQQKRHRYSAAFIAMVATPFQPMMALAATPAALPITNQKVEMSEMDMGSLGGLQMLDDSELSDVSAQGISMGQIDLDLLNQASTVNNPLHFKPRDFEDDEESREELIAQDLTDTVLDAAGIGPIAGFLDSDLSIEGVKYQEGRAPIEILPDGSLKFYMPTEIARISMENIRVKGDDSGATFGNVYMSGISYHPESNYTIRPRN